MHYERKEPVMFPTREEAKALLAEAADGTFTKS